MYEPLTTDERKRINRLFECLWGNREGVAGSFAASSYRSHPTFIRRGALLLRGETSFGDLYVLAPATAEVKPQPCQPAAHFDNFPEIVGGRAIRISESEPGVWWDALRCELPKMEAEIEASEARAREAREAAEQEQRMQRAAELAQAKAAIEATSA